MLNAIEAEITNGFVGPINSIGLLSEFTITKVNEEPSSLWTFSLYNSVHWFTIGSQVSKGVCGESHLIVLIDLRHQSLWT